MNTDYIEKDERILLPELIEKYKKLILVNKERRVQLWLDLQDNYSYQRELECSIRLFEIKLKKM